MHDYIVVGAGITGLYLAYKLQKEGANVLLLEKNNDLGGLAGITKIQGQFIEKAYHHYFPSDKLLLDLLQELGLSSAMTWQSVPMGVLMNKKVFSFSTPLDLLRLPNMTLGEKIRLGLATRRLQKMQNWQEQRHITAEEWLIKNCGTNVYEQFWQPLLKGKFHNHYQKISLSWLWARLYSRGQAKKSIFAQEKLGYLEGSISVLIEALAKKLKGKILKGQNIINIKKSMKGIVVKTATKTYDAKKLIFTTPTSITNQLMNKSSTLREIHSSDKNKKNYDFHQSNNSKKVQYLGAVVGMFATPQLLTDYYWINVNDAPLKGVPAPIIVFINHTALVSKQLFKGQYIYYYGAYLPHDHVHFKDTTLFRKDSFAYLKKIFPHFDPAAIVEQQVNKLAYAQHVVDTKYHQYIPSYQLNKGSEDYLNEKKESLVYLCNYSQIYPFDRGVNDAIVNADTFLAEIL